MSDNNIFETATRSKLRFDTTRGDISVEDLWDLTLSALNMLAKNLNKEIKSSEEEDFLQEATAEDAVTVLKFAVVIHILNTKKAEKEAAEKAAENKTTKDKLLAVLARKQDEKLDNKSEAEIRKMIEKL